MNETYSRQIKMAQKLIAKKGQKVIWRQVNDGEPADPSKPWIPGPPVNTDNEVSIVFLPSDRKGLEFLRYLKGTEVPIGTLSGLLPNVSFSPKVKDLVIRGDQELVIRTIDPIAPAEQTLLYVMEFEQ